MDMEKGMKSIWFFVGLIMMIIGIIVFIAGIYDFINPVTHEIKLTNLHANIWWGAIITIIGVIYTVKNKNKYR